MKKIFVLVSLFIVLMFASGQNITQFTMNGTAPATTVREGDTVEIITGINPGLLLFDSVYYLIDEHLTDTPDTLLVMTGDTGYLVADYGVYDSLFIVAVARDTSLLLDPEVYVRNFVPRELTVYPKIKITEFYTG
ncbi:MAG: hypothetical protein LBE56_12475 [Tannerella sp.]|jgi:hypothetical protein|nr:hypothetical protein [Tannerella sp.]